MFKPNEPDQAPVAESVQAAQAPVAESPAQPAVPDTIQIQDLDVFVKLLVSWHSKKVSVLEHMLSTPENAEVTFNEAAPVVLTGPFREGFMIGLNLALMELGTLPFGYEKETADEPAQG